MSALARPTSSDTYPAPSTEFSNHNGHGDFDLDEAAMLQHMARSGGGAAEVAMYPYEHGEQDGENATAQQFPDPVQLLENYNKENGREGRLGTSANDGGNGNGEGLEYQAYPHPPSAQEDDMDPAALLESLANFEHTPMNNGNNNAIAGQEGQHHDVRTHQFSNDHFASLLQAAATAGQSQDNDHHNRSSGRTSRGQSLDWSRGPVPHQDSLDQPPHLQHPQPQGQKRKRSSVTSQQPDAANTPGFIKPQTRRKKPKEVDPDQLARERLIWGPPSDASDASDDESPSSFPPVSPSSARAAGVHSAAALFRRPTPASKKYTRPPMSKLFTSLELNPEQFLYLQAAAKSYMLDPAHPERINCVGNKGRVDSDMVKLKLFGCVNSFLEDEGWGERCWGASADRGGDVDGILRGAGEAVPARRLKWPQGRNKIITLVTPLMRRMVTNERQRLYANETRRATGGKNKTQASSQTNAQAQASTLGNAQQYPEIDPKLGDYHYNLDPVFRSTDADSSTATAAPTLDASATATPSQPTPTTQYRISMLAPTSTSAPSCPARLLHTSTLTPITCPVFSSLMTHIRSVLASPLQPPATDAAADARPELFRSTAVKALTPRGLVEVSTVEQWEEACKEVEGAVWMEGVVRVVVEIEKVGERRGSGTAA